MRELHVVLLLSLIVMEAGAQTQTPPAPEVLLGSDPVHFSKSLEAARPAPVSPEVRTRILASLPAEGEIRNLNSAARRKVAAVIEALRAAKRDQVFEVKVIDVPQAAVGLHERVVLLISKPALDLVDADQLLALAAHEIAHEYVWREFADAFRIKDQNRLRELELTCDGIAIMTLRQLGKDPMRLISAIERIVRFNRDRFGFAMNENNYPTVQQRRTFAEAVLAWAAR